MVTTGLLVRLEAQPGKEQELAAFLTDALPLVEDEPDTLAWFAVRTGASSFAIVDVFPDEAGRQAHLDGPVAAALIAKGVWQHETNETLAFPVPPERALDAFYHPFAHLPAAIGELPQQGAVG